MACAIAGITVNPFNALFYLPLAKPNHLWVTLEYLTGSREVVDLYPLFSRAVERSKVRIPNSPELNYSAQSMLTDKAVNILDRALAKPNHLWVTLEYLTGSREVVDLYPLFSTAKPPNVGTFWWILVRTFGQKKCPKRWFWAFWYTLVL